MMVVEIVAFIVILLLIGLWAAMHPEILTSLQQFGQRMSTSQIDPEALMQMVAPLMRNPWMIFGVISIVAGLVPLIEELLKPLAVWLLAGRRPSPAEGFVAGALCGAGFGMIESMLYLINPTSESWAFLAAGRAGTIMLHTTTTALVGWAMALAWRDGAYVRLGGTYLLAVILHGLWNGLAVLTGFSVYLETAPENMRLLYELSRMAPFGISALAVAIFGLLLWGNHYLRSQAREVPLPVEPSAVETRRNP
jgi:RsiW-degrading membrane proteinase PrsW (M82 family)